MATSRGSGVDFRQRRRWSFADCVFDEANWTLCVAGRRVAVETKPLEFLRELLLRAGNVVSKEELLDAVWPDVEVVEASLTTAVMKLRTALADDRRKARIIETVPRIGYRLAVPVEVDDLQMARHAPDAAAPSAVHLSDGAGDEIAANSGRQRHVGFGLWMLFAAAGLAIGAAATGYLLATSRQTAADQRPLPYSQTDVAVAIRKLDIDAVERMLAAGWDPNSPWDKEGNNAFTALLDRCEWDPGHDRRKMLLMARTLIEGGLQIDHRNVWGDTPYSIAKAPRFCGPDHPVTQMLEAMCFGGSMGPKDLCLATYQLTAEQRRAQGFPPKGNRTP